MREAKDILKFKDLLEFISNPAAVYKRYCANQNDFSTTLYLMTLAGSFEKIIDDRYSKISLSGYSDGRDEHPDTILYKVKEAVKNFQQALRTRDVRKANKASEAIELVEDLISKAKEAAEVADHMEAREDVEKAKFWSGDQTLQATLITHLQIFRTYVGELCSQLGNVQAVSGRK